MPSDDMSIVVVALNMVLQAVSVVDGRMILCGNDDRML